MNEQLEAKICLCGTVKQSPGSKGLFVCPNCDVTQEREHKIDPKTGAAFARSATLADKLYQKAITALSSVWYAKPGKVKANAATPGAVESEPPVVPSFADSGAGFEFLNTETGVWTPAHSIDSQAAADRMNKMMGKEFYRARKVES